MMRAGARCLATDGNVEFVGWWLREDEDEVEESRRRELE